MAWHLPDTGVGRALALAWHDIDVPTGNATASQEFHRGLLHTATSFRIMSRNWLPQSANRGESKEAGEGGVRGG